MFPIPQLSNKVLQELKDIYRNDFSVELTGDQAMKVARFVYLLTSLQRDCKHKEVVKTEAEPLLPIELEHHEDGIYWLSIPLQPTQKPKDLKADPIPTSSPSSEG